MTLFEATANEGDRDYTAGLKHVLLTWLLAAPPIVVMVLGLIGAFLEQFNILDRGGSRDVALVLMLVALSQWLFTLAAAVSAVTLTFRSVTAQKKISGWVAVALALLANFFIASTYRW